jgi:putative methionine-R-sulfoxide reductase with GAF domain
MLAVAAVVGAGLVLRLFAHGRFKSPVSLVFEALVPVALIGLASLKVFFHSQATAPDRTDDVETGLIALAAAAVVVQLAGGLRSPLFPLVYLVVALVVGFIGAGTTLLFIFLVGAVEGLSALIHGEFWANLGLIATHLVFMGGFAVVIGSLLARERRKADRAETVLERLQVAAPERQATDEVGEESPSGAATLPVVAPIGAVFELDGVLFDLVRVLHRAIGARGVLLGMLDREGRTLVVRQSVTDGVEPAGAIALRDLDKALSRSLADRHWALLSEIDEAAKGASFYARGERSRSACAAPLIAADVAIGMLLADSPEPGRFGREQARLVAQVADFAGTLVERAARMDEMRAEVEAVRGLERAALSLLAATDDAPTLLAREARALTRAAASLVVRAEGDALVVAAVDGADADLVGRRVARDEGLVGRAIQGNQTWLEPDLRAWEKRVGRSERRPVLGRSLRLREARGLFVAPIAASGRRLGALVCLADGAEEFVGLHVPAVEILVGVAAQAWLLEGATLPPVETAGVDAEDAVDGAEEVRAAIARTRETGRPVAILVAAWDGPWPDVWERIADAIGREEARVAFLHEGRVGIVLEGADALDAGHLFARLRTAAGDRRTAGGVAVHPAAGRSAGEVLSRADAALARARADGGGRIYAWTAEALHRV